MTDIESIDRTVKPGDESDTPEMGDLLFDCPDEECGNKVYENWRVIDNMVMCQDCWDYEHGEITLEELRNRKR